MALTRISNDTLQDTAVSTSKLQDLAVSTSKLQDAAVSTLKLQDLAVSSGKLQDATITQSKLGAEFTDIVVLNSANSSLDIDFSLGTSFTLLADQGNFYTLTFTNYNIGDVKSISCTVASTFGLSFNATGKTIVILNGEIDPNVDLNFIQVLCVDTNTFYLTISSLTP